MKTTTFFYSVLLSVMAFVFVSCGSGSQKVEYRKAQDNISYQIKQIDGKRLWGLAANVELPNGIAEVMPCQFDSIYSIHETLQYAFIAIRDGKMYAIDIAGKRLLDGQSFTSFGFVSEDDPLNSAFIERQPAVKFECSDGNRFITFDQYYAEPNGMQVSIIGYPEYRSFGPYENLFAGKESLLFSKNGKWGFSAQKIGKEMLKGKGTFAVTYELVKAPQYDGIIEVSGKGMTTHWLVKSGTKWSAIDDEGSPLKMSQGEISGYLKSKKTNWAGFNETWIKKRQRIGTENLGCIIIPSGW